MYQLTKQKLLGAITYFRDLDLFTMNSCANEGEEFKVARPSICIGTPPSLNLLYLHKSICIVKRFSLNFIRLLRVVLTPSVTSESTGR